MSEDNPKNISEIERIKWLISRIDLYHKLSLDIIEDSKKKFSDAEEMPKKRIRSIKKGVFSILGVILSITFGINSVQPMEIESVYMILTSISVAAILSYLFFTWVDNFFSYSFSILSKITEEAKSKVVESQAFVALNFADLGYLDIKKIKDYGVFVILLRVAIGVYMMNELKRDKSYKTKWMRDELKDVFKEAEKLTKEVPALYNRFNILETCPESCLDFVENTLKDYKKIQK